MKFGNLILAKGSCVRSSPIQDLINKKQRELKLKHIKYFRIKNWEKYQHRDAIRHGSMPWIKLDTMIGFDEKVIKMKPHQALTWILLLANVGRTGNKIAHDPRIIRASLPLVNFKRALDLQFLWDMGLIEEWTASLDKDKDETKTQTETLRQRTAGGAPKKSYQTSKKCYHSSSKKIHESEDRLAHNLRIGRGFVDEDSVQKK